MSSIVRGNSWKIWWYITWKIANTSGLKSSLEEWAKRYDAILNIDDPASSGFKNKEEEKLFIDDGYKSAQRLREELGNEYEIIYHILRDRFLR